MHAVTSEENNLVPVSTQLVVSRISDKLRDDIISGAIAPGAVINSVELARQFGTSRTPVREALILLSQDGLVSIENYRRPRVTHVSVDAIRDLYGFRETVHAYIATTLVQSASDGDLASLGAMANELLLTADDAAEPHMRGVEAYIAEEVRLCRNEIVASVLSGLKFKIRWFRRVGMPSAEQFHILAQDRIRAAAAYVDRDALLAEAINRSMVRKGAVFCEQNFLQHAARTVTSA